MIVKIDKEESSFLQFMTEADGDTPRRNMKVLNLRVSDKRRPDYTAGADVSDEEEEPAEDTGAEEPVTDNDTEDYTDTEAPEETETPEDDTGGEEPVVDDGGEDFTDGADDTADAGTEPAEDGAEATGDEPVTDDTGGDPAEGGEEGGDEPVVDDGGEDFTDGADDAGDAGDDAGGDTTDDTTTDDDSGGDSGEENNVEKMYKYNLFLKFKKVLSTISNYSKELENIISDDADTNQKYKELTSKLNTIKELMEDYMIMKFSKVSYMQSMLFYQRVIAGVNIILETIKRIQKIELKSK